VCGEYVRIGFMGFGGNWGRTCRSRARVLSEGLRSLRPYCQEKLRKQDDGGNRPGGAQ
jgi:hypothetical protein